MKFKIVPIFIFLVACLFAWEINVLGHIFFPSTNLFPFLIRTGLTLLADMAIISLSLRLLKDKGALGVSISAKTIVSIVWGLAIGAGACTMLAGLLHIFVPYYFVAGPLHATEAWQEIANYAVGNLLEELIFRGFLFVVLSQIIGWRFSVLVMAIPFGFFHLQGSGLDVAGQKMVVTTACYSLVFSLTFVYFRSIWVSAAVHVMSNIGLHVITGLDGENRSLLTPMFESNWPFNYDPGFPVMILTSLVIAGVLYYAIIKNTNVYEDVASNKG